MKRHFAQRKKSIIKITNAYKTFISVCSLYVCLSYVRVYLIDKNV